LSVTGIRSIPGIPLSGGKSSPGDTRVRGRVSAGKLDCACFGHRSLTSDPSPPRTTRKSYGPRVPDRTMVAILKTISALLVSEDWLRREEAMKTAGRENQTRYATAGSVPSSRNGSREQSCLMGWAGRQEKLRPQVKCFFLTPFIELTRSSERSTASTHHIFRGASSVEDTISRRQRRIGNAGLESSDSDLFCSCHVTDAEAQFFFAFN
jgi:hypothetical protein